MATAHLLADTLPLSSIKLGRLILNTTPHQQFIDPLDSRPSSSETTQTDHHLLQETLRFSKLPPHLTNTLPTPVPRTPLAAALTAPRATSYNLTNPAAWLTSACSRPPTRRFLEDAFDNQDEVYLIVGLRTVQDALVKGVTLEIQGTTCCPLNSDVTPTGYGLGIPTKPPGEQVFVVLYHRVAFKCLSSRYINTRTIVEDNRWMSAWCWRGPVQEYERDEEDDVLEARLVDVEDASDGDLESMDVSRDSMDIGGERVKRKLELELGSVDDEIWKRLKFSFDTI